VYNPVLVEKARARPEKKRAIDSNGSKRRVNGFPRIHASVVTKLWSEVRGQPEFLEVRAHIRNDKKGNLLSSETRSACIGDRELEYVQ
jgi:hypothetical protein